MLTNTPYLRTGLFLGLLFTLSAAFYQVVSYQLSHDRHHQDDHHQRVSPTNEALHYGTVELPLFPGCADKGDYTERKRCARVKMARYLDKNINQKLIDRKGRVYVRFTVDLAGQLQNAHLAQKTDPVLAAEVMRLIGLQQGEDIRWTPGKIKGTPRAMNATLQVSFGQRCKGCEQVMVEMIP